MPRYLDRRSVLIALAAMGIGSSVDARHRKHKHKHKKPKPVPPSPPPPSPPPPPTPGQCDDRGGNAAICGPYCCNFFPVCCDYALDINGKKCYDTESTCCPASTGGGACALNETCCPPRKGGLVSSCANTGLSDHCCAPDSGGSCPATKDCCPSSTTNSVNQGCCKAGRACCNVAADCNTAAGEVCGQFDGCCGPF